MAARRRDARPRAPARAVDHDADDALLRARRAARATGRAELVAHGLASLRDDFRDAEHGGWFAQVGGSTDKRAYEHVFVVLAAASAGDAELLGEALEVLETHFWDERAGALVDVCNRDWTDARGLPRREREHARRRGDARHRGPAVARAGAAGHAAARGRQPSAAQRALRRRLAAAAGLQPSTSPRIRSGRTGRRSGTGSSGRGWRYTLGGFEADARRLFAAGVRDGWDGSGFVYTVDWDGRPVVADRLHWVLCEAIAAAAVLGRGRAAGRSGGSSPSATSSTATAARGATSSIRPTGRRAPSGTASPTSTTHCRRRSSRGFRLRLRWRRRFAGRRRRHRRRRDHQRERGEPDEQRERAPRAAAPGTRSGRRRS